MQIDVTGWNDKEEFTAALEKLGAGDLFHGDRRSIASAQKEDPELRQIIFYL